MDAPNASGILGFPRAAALFGAGTGALATAMGAVGSHWVGAHAPAGFAAAFQTATAFALWHALALLGLAWASQAMTNTRLLRIAGAAWMAGIVLFCGSLWLRGLGCDPRIVRVAPIGGSLLIIGWLITTFFIARLRSKR